MLAIALLLAIFGGVANFLAFPPFVNSKSASIEGLASLIWLVPGTLTLAVYLYLKAKQSVASTHNSTWRLVRGAFLLGYLQGLIFFLVSLNWLREVSWAGAIALPAYLALYRGLFAALAVLILEKESSLTNSSKQQNINAFGLSYKFIKIAFILSCLWVASEWLRANLLSGFGWNNLAAALQNGYQMFFQIADIFGTGGVSFVICYVSIIFAFNILRFFTKSKTQTELVTLRRRRVHLDFFSAVILLFLCFFYSLQKYRSFVAKKKNPKANIKILAGFVQPNSTREDKMDNELLKKHINYLGSSSYTLAVAKPDIIFWPETAVIEHFHLIADWVDEVARATQTPLLFGNVYVDLDEAKIYNAATLAQSKLRIADQEVKTDPIFDEEISYQHYFKRHLVPFGEFLPLRFLAEYLRKIAPQLPMGQDFSRGKEFNNLLLFLPDEKTPVRIAPLICFEDTLPELAKNFVLPNAPQLLVNLTNDNWFGHSASAQQHLNNSRLRAVELRRPLARVTNTGVTAVINSLGYAERELRRQNDGSTFFQAIMNQEIELEREPPITFYVRLGYFFPRLCLLIAMWFVLKAFLFNKKTI